MRLQADIKLECLRGAACDPLQTQATTTSNPIYSHEIRR
jgi:hypothetical protein